MALYRTGTPFSARSVIATAVASPDGGRVPTPSLGSAPGAGSVPYGGAGAIAFTIHRNGTTHLYAMNQATREVVRLTSNSAETRDPAWSPDGRLLAFASHRGRNWDIYLLDLDGGALIRLTRSPAFDAGPTWSPDGTRIAFESYRNSNLDIYVMDADGRNLQRLTSDPAPEHSPAWSPDSSAIAYVSFQNGNQDVFLLLLEGELAGAVINITNSPNVNETDPAWSPDGRQLAYVIEQAGQTTVQVSAVEWRAAGEEAAEESELYLSSATLFGPGFAPAWAPDGQGVVTVYRHEGHSYLIASSLHGWALSQEVYSSEGLIDDPVWEEQPLSARAIAHARAAEAAADPPLYDASVQPTPPLGAPFRLVELREVSGTNGTPLLSDRVDDSFNALRQRVIEESGWDYLSVLDAAWLPMDYSPEPGHSRMSWNVCGRAIDIDQTFYDADDQLIYLTREDVGSETYWRVHIRAADQNGSMGEPLRVAPWDLRAREEGETVGVQGGRLLEEIPPGYYVDFTALASDYGWERVPALPRWRYSWPDVLWWHFQQTSGLGWWDCMLELHEPEEIEASFGPIPEEGEEWLASVTLVPPAVGTPWPRATRSPLPFVCELAYQQPPYASPWSGVAGHFQDQTGNPLPGYHAQVECPGAGTFTLRAGADERLNNIYGNPAAWEQSCNPTAYQPMEVRVRLFNDHPDPDGTTQQVSELVIVQLRGDIYGSLGYVTCTLNWQGWR